VAEKTYKVKESTMKRIVRMLEWYENERSEHSPQESRKRQPESGPFRVVRTRAARTSEGGKLDARTIAKAPNTGTGALAEASIGTLATTDNVIVWDLDAVKCCRLAVPIGFNTTSGKPIYAAIPRGVFPVVLVQTGGSAGTQSTVCSYTYTVRDLNLQDLATVVTPTWDRSTAGLRTAAAAGLGWWSGSVLQVFAFEQFSTEACS
jgi:hypothetical protein